MFAREAKKKLGKGADAFLASTEPFEAGYQAWYSAALALLRQLLPDRVSDFTQYYEPAKIERRFPIALIDYRTAFSAFKLRTD